MNTSPTNQVELSQNLIEPRKDLKLFWEAVRDKIKIKQPIWLIISVILTIAGVWFLIDRIELIQVGEHVLGKVVNITQYNSRCGSKNNKYDCTEFTGHVDFSSLKGEKGNINIGGGSSHGHNKPIDYASIKIGQSIKVIYDPSDLARAYEDTLWGIWGAPIMTLIFQITSFFSAFAEPKKRYN